MPREPAWLTSGADQAADGGSVPVAERRQPRESEGLEG
jgi:hypothetical protein